MYQTDPFSQPSLTPDFLPGNGGREAHFGGSESRVFPIFYKGQKYMPAASQDRGTPVVAAVDYVKIMQAGEKDTTIEEVHDGHKRRWPQQWAAYMAGNEQVQSGTPLALLFPGNPEVVDTLRRMHVHTVQALEAMPDSSQGRDVPFLVVWKKKAREFLAVTEKGKGFHELEAKLADANQRNEEMQARLQALEERLMAEPAKKGKAA